MKLKPTTEHGVTCRYCEQVEGAINEYWRRGQVFDKLEASPVSGFRAVHDLALITAFGPRDRVRSW